MVHIETHRKIILSTNALNIYSKKSEMFDKKSIPCASKIDRESSNGENISNEIVFNLFE